MVYIAINVDKKVHLEGLLVIGEVIGMWMDDEQWEL